jgi:hypothetical protein
MTIEQHLRTLIGDLLFRMAQLSAEIDTLKDQLAARSDVPPSARPRGRGTSPSRVTGRTPTRKTIVVVPSPEGQP